MALPILLILVCISAYSLVIFTFSGGIKRTDIAPFNGDKLATKVSIIIPFRNEANHLPLLVRDLMDQAYPPSLWEVIWVNDHSTDGSGEILDSLLSGTPGFKQLKLPNESAGKKAALFHGIQAATNDRLIQVDADCRLGPQFISSHMAFLEEHPADLVAGLVITYPVRRRFLEIFEHFDLLALVGTGAGSFGTGRPMMCNGANLAYSRDLYTETRSYDPKGLTRSGDDMFLMIGARKLNRTLAFNTDRDACVRTSPVDTFRDLLAQRIRWGAKSTRYGMADIQGLAVLVILTNLGIILMPLWFFLFPGWWHYLAGAWILKSLADFVLLFRVSGLIHQRRKLLWYIPVSLAYYPVFFLSLFGILMGKGAWER